MATLELICGIFLARNLRIMNEMLDEITFFDGHGLLPQLGTCLHALLDSGLVRPLPRLQFGHS